MSFVHCPSCHRAYDLRRQASCPACRQRDEAAAKVAPAPVVAEPAAAAGEADADLIVVVEPEAGTPAAAAAFTGEPSDAELKPYSEPPRPQRIVEMVEELAALLERATSEELEAARAGLEQRGLRAPWTAQLTSGGRFLLAAGEKLVTSAIRAPQQGARKLARRLRDAWSGASPRL